MPFLSNMDMSNSDVVVALDDWLHERFGEDEAIDSVPGMIRRSLGQEPLRAEEDEAPLCQPCAVRLQDLLEGEVGRERERKSRLLRQAATDAGHDALPSFLFQFHDAGREPQPPDFGPERWAGSGTCYPGCPTCELSTAQ